MCVYLEVGLLSPLPKNLLDIILTGGFAITASSFIFSVQNGIFVPLYPVDCYGRMVLSTDSWLVNSPNYSR